VLTIQKTKQILLQAVEAGGIEKIFFEGGEPFLYYPILLNGAQEAVDMGFKVGIVSNAYWATSREDARAFLQPFVGLLEDLTISSDLYHYSELNSLQSRNAVSAADDLGIEAGTISIAQPENDTGSEGTIMFRGRAARQLAGRRKLQSWDRFTSCPFEDLRDPGRVHVDPFGYIHVCQGISIGNLFETPLADIQSGYKPDEHPVIGPLLEGGPVALVNEYALPHAGAYADACHLCDSARRSLREKFPEILTPDQMYGEPEDFN
jgi:hypothetical protein